MTDAARVTLVAGYPRLLARELARTSAQAGDTALVLVRPRDHARAAAELPESEHLRLVTGDPTAIDLGLSGAAYVELLGSVTHVHHVTPRAKGKAHDDIVASTREFLEFVAGAKRVECGMHHSTVQVFGDREGTLDEAARASGEHTRNPKEHALALAETLVDRELVALPLAIARAGNATGHSITGETEPENGIYLLALLCLSAPSDLRLPFPGRGEWQLNLVPVDWVAQAAVQLARHPRAPHGRFHLVDPAPFSARRVFELVAQAASALRETGGRRPFMPAGFTRALLRAPGLEPLVRSPRAFLEAWLRDVRFDATQAQALLGTSAPPCPSFADYVGRVVERVAENARTAQRERVPTRELEEEDPLL